MQIWPAPAKLNLFLHVTGRRPDGYHTLQTVFQFLDLADELRIEVTADGDIRRARPLAGVAEEQDLCVRAARLLQAESACRQGANIHLHKRIPQGGGLGGGSSDAATTLLALNHLWDLGLPRAKLATLGLRLGADVPVFVWGQAAWAEGVGEELTPMALPECWYVVVDPGARVSTAEVFAHPDLTRHSRPLTIRDFHAGRASGNDLEAVVRRLHPAVDAALEWSSGHGPARMTGSGACVFLPVADRQAGEAILARCPPAFTGIVARGMNTHPINRILEGKA